MDSFVLAKCAHIVGAAVLLGTGAGIAWFQREAFRTGDLDAIAAVAPLVVKADWTFTLTAGIAQPISGAALIWLAGWDPLAPWLVWAYVLYGLVFACWAPVVWLQLRLARVALAAKSAGAPLPEDAHAVMRHWTALGVPAFAAMLGLVWLMVAKPGF